KTALVLDAYFSGTKLAWLLDHVADARAAAERGELAFGTVDSWLLWMLTGALDIRRALLAAVHPSSHEYGHTRTDLLGASIPIGGVAGDQQSALFGQACFGEGQVKNTYGTGCFMLMNTGTVAETSANGLITTRAAQPAGPAQYATEGSVFIGGAVVQWLRDGLRAITASSEVQKLAESVPDNGGVMFVPAFTGLGAPYWRPDARLDDRAHRPCRSRIDRFPERGPARRDEQGRDRRRRRRRHRAACRRRRLGQRSADAVPGRSARHPGAAAEGHRDDGARRGLSRGPRLRRLHRHRRARRALADRSRLPSDAVARARRRADAALGTRRRPSGRLRRAPDAKRPR